MNDLKRFAVFALFGLLILSVVIVMAQQQGARGGQRGGAPVGGPEPAGMTVTGEVQNYVPVTDAMLKSPDPGDWLMIRRDYSASDYAR